MDQHHQPSKEEIREWLAEQVELKTPVPEPEVIRSRLWPIEERERKAGLT